MDPKVLILCKKIGLDGITIPYSKLANKSYYNKIVNILNTMAYSTAEDYIWRLCRCLKQKPGFPTDMILLYDKLLAHYKNQYY